MKKLLRHILTLTFVLLAGGGAQAASESTAQFDFQANYTKAEYRIRMRDGVRLFTAVYAPKVAASGGYPFLLRRTAYGAAPYGADKFPTGPWVEGIFPSALAKSGYIFVIQEGRGRGASEGVFSEYSPRRDLRNPKTAVDESTDTYDTVEWLLANVRGNNGKAGITGGSYDGFYVAASIRNTHPAIKAAMIELMGDWNYRHGAFMIADTFEFYMQFRRDNTQEELESNFGSGAKYSTYDPYALLINATPLSRLNALYFDKKPNDLWTDIVEHNTYDDFWQQRNLLTHLQNVRCAVLNVHAWFDQYVGRAPIDFYHTIEKDNPKGFNSLIIGPWSHVALFASEGDRLGDVEFDSATAAYFRDKVRIPFLEHFLKGKEAEVPEVLAFETGSNAWREYPQWPPAGSREETLYFHSAGSLSFEQPETASGFDEYVSDPAKPIPLLNYAPVQGWTLIPPEYMSADQRFAARRPDVLAYQTEPLKEDLTVAGPVSPQLFVASTGSDSDWVVKLIDVYPDDFREPQLPEGSHTQVAAPRNSMGGYQQLVRGEPIRGKFRNGWEEAQAIPSGEVVSIKFDMADINHTFRKGHRIMIQVQSSWFPLIDVNPQTFVNIPEATPDDFQKATQRVYRSKLHPSGIVLRSLPPPKAH